MFRSYVSLKSNFREGELGTRSICDQRHLFTWILANYLNAMFKIFKLLLYQRAANLISSFATLNAFTIDISGNYLKINIPVKILGLCSAILSFNVRVQCLQQRLVNF